MKKSPEWYLHQLENDMCDRILIPNGENLFHDHRFNTTAEMQAYNNGIAECMRLVSRILDSDDFKPDLFKEKTSL